MQQPPQAMAAPQLPTPMGRGGGFLWGCGMNGSQHVLRVGERWLHQGDLIRHRFACQEIISRPNEGIKLYSSYNGKPHRNLRSIQGDVPGFAGSGSGVPVPRIPMQLHHGFQPGHAAHPNAVNQSPIQPNHPHMRAAQASLQTHSHNSSAPPSVPQTLHYNPQTNAIPQHPTHHSSIPGAAVSGPGGIPNTVHQAVLPSSTIQANQGPTHEIGQPISSSSGQLTQSSGVPLQTAHMNMIYPPNTQTPQPPGPTQQNPQNHHGYYHPSQVLAKLPAQMPPGYQIHVIPGGHNYGMMPTAYQVNQPRAASTNGPQHAYSQIGHQAPYYQQMAASGGVYYPQQAAYQPQAKAQPFTPSVREKKVLSIKNPETLEEIEINSPSEPKPDKGPSPENSRESSARNTPAPKDSRQDDAVRSEFATKVASAAAADKAIEANQDIVDCSSASTLEEKEACTGVSLDTSDRDKIENKVEYISQSRDSACSVPEFDSQINNNSFQPTVHHTLPPQPIPPPQQPPTEPIYLQQSQQPITLHAPQKIASPSIPQAELSTLPPQINPEGIKNEAEPPTLQAASTLVDQSNEATVPAPKQSLQKQQANLVAATTETLPLQPLQVPQVPSHSQAKVSNVSPPTVQGKSQQLLNRKQSPPPPPVVSQTKQSTPPLDTKVHQGQAKVSAPPQIQANILKSQHGGNQHKMQQQGQSAPVTKVQQPQVLSKSTPQQQQQQQPPPPSNANKGSYQQVPQAAKASVPSIPPKMQGPPPPQQQPLNPQSKSANQARAASQKQVAGNVTQGQGKSVPTPNATPPAQAKPVKQKNNQPAYTQSPQVGKNQTNQTNKAPQGAQTLPKSNNAPKIVGALPKVPVSFTKGGNDLVAENEILDESKTRLDNEGLPSSSQPQQSTVATEVPKEFSQPPPQLASTIVKDDLKQTTTNIESEDPKERPSAAATPEEVQKMPPQMMRNSRESSEEIPVNIQKLNSCMSMKQVDSQDVFPNSSSSTERQTFEPDVTCPPPPAPASSTPSPLDIKKDLSKVDVQPGSKSSSSSPLPHSKREYPEVNLEEGKPAGASREVNALQDKPKEMPTAVEQEKTKVESELDLGKTKIKYDRSFLLEFQRATLSLKRPESLPNLEVVLDGPVSRSYDRPPKMSMDFTPNYLQQGRGNRGQMPFIPQKAFGGRNSQQGKRHPKIIEFSPSQSEVILKKVENAWKPGSKSKDPPNSEDAQTESILKKVRGILNKLTPDNFDRLVTRVREISFSNFNQFDEVITLVFEKAVSEQGFSTMYAQLCQVLSTMSVKGNAPSEGGKKDGDVTAKFKNLIINKCQKEFERENSANAKLNELAEELKQCKDPEKKTELKAEYDYEETRLRKKSVGNIRFIGELYKLKMLTSPIMMRIIGSLLDKKDEESLECLCKLLQTIGKSLDTNALTSQKAQVELNKHFKIMHDLVEYRQTSSRVRFLIMNVIDMRKDDWTPRREDAKPKTKAEVHQDIKKEEFEASLILHAPPPPRRDDHRERKRSRDNRMDEWTMVNSNNQRRQGLEQSRVMAISGNRMQGGQDSVHLRPPTNLWGSGSSGGFKDSSERVDNRFAPLQENSYSSENKRPLNVGPRLAPGGNMGVTSGFNRHFGGSKSMPPPSEKPMEFNRNMHLSDHSKSSSRSSSREGSLQREIKAPPPSAVHTPHTPPPPPMNVDEANKRTLAIIEEFISIKDKKEARTCVEEKFNSSSMHLFVQASFEWVLDKDSDKRKLVGQFFHYLFSCELLTPVMFANGAKPVVELVEDFAIDIPQVSLYVGEVFAPILIDAVFPIHKMVEIFDASGSKKADLTANLIKAASKLFGSNKVSELWSESKLNWNKILPQGASIKEFVDKHNLGFLSSFEGIQECLYQMFKKDDSLDTIFAWINQNVEDVTNKKFIRALATSLVESQINTADGLSSSIVIDDNFENKIKAKLKSVYKYVDNTDERELQCLFALQAISVKFQHPPGLLEKCFNAFYDTEVVSEDTFFMWIKNQDPEEQVGKGVCVTSVNKFMKWLEETETEDVDYP